jgi:hypothetical protein
MNARIIVPVLVALLALAAAPALAFQLIPDSASYDAKEDDPVTPNLDMLTWLYAQGLITETQFADGKKALGGKDYFGLRPTGSVVASVTPYTQMKYDEVVSYPGSPDDERGFRLAKASLGFLGKIYFDWLTFKVTSAIEPTADGKYAFGLEYAYLRGRYTPKSLVGGVFVPSHGLVAGAMKVPFSRQNMTSTEQLQFINRAMVVEEMPIRYDVGAVLEGDYNIARDIADLTWSFGVFNGRGDKVYGVDNNDALMYALRTRLDLIGPMRPGEGDPMSRYYPGQALSTGDPVGPRLSLGFSWLQNNDLDRVVKAWGVDGEFRWSGLSLQGEYLFTRYEPDLGETLVGDQYARNWETSGWYLQGGLFVVPRHLELAARYDEYSLDLLDDLSPKRKLVATTVGINYHFASKHRLKLMADYVFRNEIEGMPHLNNDTATIQASLQF